MFKFNPSPTTNLLNVFQSKCLPLGPPSEPKVNSHDRSSANLSESDEHRFPNTYVIFWNMNGVQNFNKLRILQKMAKSCQPLFILIQESHSDSECDFDFIRNQLKKYIWLKDNSSRKRRGLLIRVKQMEGVKEISPCTWGWAQAALAVGAICGFESDCWRGFNTLKVS